MWNRITLKEDGKAAFRRNYWKCVVVALIASAAVTLIQVACTASGGGFSLPGCLLMIAAFLALRVKVKGKGISPILVMALCGLGGILLHAVGWM